jgi:activator of HSP90 ATPase
MRDQPYPDRDSKERAHEGTQIEIQPLAARPVSSGFGDVHNSPMAPSCPPTRRQLISGAAIALGSLAVPAAAEANSSPNTFHQEIEFEASPSRIYEILLDDKQFSSFSGAPAEIQPGLGGAFKLFGGPTLKGVIGRNLELIPDQRIIQAWRANVWLAGVYSVVRFELTRERTGTRIVFDQAGLGAVPQAVAWNHMYWDPLRKFLGA